MISYACGVCGVCSVCESVCVCMHAYVCVCVCVSFQESCTEQKDILFSSLSDSEAIPLRSPPPVEAAQTNTNNSDQCPKYYILRGVL